VENVEIARRLFDAFTRRDVGAATALLREDMEFHPALTAGGVEGVVYRGAGGVGGWFRELEDTWSELAISSAEFHEVDENQVLILGRFEAVGKESGLRVEAPQALLVRIEDGEVAGAWGFASHEEGRRAAGLEP
jgi:ketosteroid isomerase-like protein